MSKPRRPSQVNSANARELISSHSGLPRPDNVHFRSVPEDVAGLSIERIELANWCFWYPFRPWLRWPIRLLGAIGIIAVVAKLAIHNGWAELPGVFAPLSLFLISFVSPEPRPKARMYLVASALVRLAVAFTLMVIGLWILTR